MSGKRLIQNNLLVELFMKKIEMEIRTGHVVEFSEDANLNLH